MALLAALAFLSIAILLAIAYENKETVDDTYNETIGNLTVTYYYPQDDSNGCC